MRLFADANVIFSAAVTPQGRSSALFRIVGSGDHRLLASEHAIEEARRNISARYPEAADRLEELVRQVHVVPDAHPELVGWGQDLGLPLGDAPILAAAVQAGADVLVTGDRKHFGHLFGQTLRGVRVLTLRDAVHELLG